MKLTSLNGIGVCAFAIVGAVLVVNTGGCSDHGPTYIIYSGGASGMTGSGGTFANGGSDASGGTNPGSGGTDPGSGGTNPGSGGANPGAGGTDPGSGGTDPGSGGTDPGSGGTDPGTGGTNPGAGGTGQTIPVTLIDDFADCEGNIYEIDGRKGAWYSLNALNTISFGPPPTISWGDQSCGAFIVGTCAGCEVAGIAVILAAGSYNLSPYSGFNVTFESDADLYVAVKNTKGEQYGYARSGAIPATGTGGVRTVYFSSLTPDDWYTMNQGLAYAQEIHFTLDDISKNSGFGLGIHRLELF